MAASGGSVCGRCQALQAALKMLHEHPLCTHQPRQLTVKAAAKAAPRPAWPAAVHSAARTQNREPSTSRRVRDRCTAQRKGRGGWGAPGGGNTLTCQLDEGGWPQRRGSRVLPCTVQQRGSHQAGGVGPQSWQEDGAPHHVQGRTSHAAQLAQVLQGETGQVLSAGVGSAKSWRAAVTWPSQALPLMQGSDRGQHDCCTQRSCQHQTAAAPAAASVACISCAEEVAAGLGAHSGSLGIQPTHLCRACWPRGSCPCPCPCV